MKNIEGEFCLLLHLEDQNQNLFAKYVDMHKEFESSCLWFLKYRQNTAFVIDKTIYTVSTEHQILTD